MNAGLNGSQSLQLWLLTSHRCTCESVRLSSRCLLSAASAMDMMQEPSWMHSRGSSSLVCRLYTRTCMRHRPLSHNKFKGIVDGVTK